MSKEEEGRFAFMAMVKGFERTSNSMAAVVQSQEELKAYMASLQVQIGELVKVNEELVRMNRALAQVLLALPPTSEIHSAMEPGAAEVVRRFINYVGSNI